MIGEFERRIGRGTIGNKAASGTVIIDELGPEHMRTGRPIVYTSADSVFQIAAHEEVIPIDELYRFCEIAFDLVGTGLGVGRVIARPFVGAPGSFSRTANRRDFALTPFAPTLLDRLKAAGRPVVAIGKIEDLFAGRGMTSAVHTRSDDHGMDEVEAAMATTPDGLIFANLVDFDTRLRSSQRSAGLRARISSASTRGSRGCCRGCGRTICSSSPPITATIRPRRAPIIRASTCRCCSAGPACAPAPTSACGRRSPISGRRSRSSSASGRWSTARSFLGEILAPSR